MASLDVAHASARRAHVAPAPVEIPRDRDEAVLEIGPKRLKLTNLGKPFWPELGLCKRDLLDYYARVSPVLLPHLRDRAMVMKRYPDGAHGEHFFMKRAPASRPAWLTTCSIEHASGSVIDFVRVQDLADLLWVVNLGCIDLNPWYSRCDDVNRPDVLHFDLDPVDDGVPFERICQVAQLVRDALAALAMPSFAKTTGSRGIHVYVPIQRGPTQKEVWSFAKAFAQAIARLDPARITSEYRIARRPAGRVLVDYNQNAWGRTLASVYSVRPRTGATVSTPVTWQELERGIRTEDFHLRNVPQRIARLGDLWAPMCKSDARFDWSRISGIDPAEAMS